ncbi:MAG: DUF1697 domain-containing protein [Vicinamibacterales bacterium]
MAVYLALLRGINVGGNNIIRMTDLKACFEGEMGFADVSTFIQSGNVIFCANRTSLPALTSSVEEALSARFGYNAVVVVLSHDMLRQVVKDAPGGFGTRPATYRYDVIFVKKPLRPAAALRHFEPRPGVDRVEAGTHAVYASRLAARAAQSRISKIASTPAYASMTIRNWNTTTKLLAIMDRAVS